MIVRAIKYSAAVLGAALLAAPAYADHVTGHDAVARGGILALEQKVFDLEQAILALPPGGPPPGPSIISVDCDLGDTIQTALDSAVDGDTINVVGGGTCLENIVVRVDHVTLDGNGTATIDGSGDSASDTVQVLGTDVTITGFTITGGRNGISVRIGGSGIIADNTITINGLHGVEVTLAAAADISNNTITFNGGRGGVVVNLGGSAEISDNIINDNTAHGINVTQEGSIQLSGPDDSPTPANTLKRNGEFGVRCGRGTVRLGAAQVFGTGADANVLGAVSISSTRCFVSNRAVDPNFQ